VLYSFTAVEWIATWIGMIHRMLKCQDLAAEPTWDAIPRIWIWFTTR